MTPWILATLLVVGCAGPIRKDAVPEDLTTQAVVPGLADVRYRAGIDREAIQREGMDSFWREQAYLKSQGHTGPIPPVYFLAVSGGGDNGAFGAGLLNGWTAAGTRPEFKLVTGVSTGALIAPLRTMSIAGRAISSLIHTQGIGDLYTIYLTAQRDGTDFNLAYVPASFDAPHREEFDTDYMRALYQTGYDMAANGYPWQKTPPGF